MKAANLPIFLKLDICVIFAKKILGGHETDRGAGAPPFGPGLKRHCLYDLEGHYCNCNRNCMGCYSASLLATVAWAFLLLFDFIMSSKIAVKPPRWTDAIHTRVH